MHVPWGTFLWHRWHIQEISYWMNGFFLKNAPCSSLSYVNIEKLLFVSCFRASGLKWKWVCPIATKKQYCNLHATHQMTHTAVVRRVSSLKTHIFSLFVYFHVSHAVYIKLSWLLDFSRVLFLAAASSFRVVCCWEYITGNFPDLLLPSPFKMSSSVHKFESELCQPLYHLYVAVPEMDTQRAAATWK